MMNDTELQALLATSPLHRAWDLKITAVDRDAQRLTMRMPFTSSVERNDGSGQYHGAAIAGLIDIAGDFALIALLGHGVPTINFRVDYLRPGTAPELTAIAQVQRLGKSVGVVDVTVEDAQGKVVALGRGCYSTRAG